MIEVLHHVVCTTLVDKIHGCINGGPLTNQQLIDKDSDRPPVTFPAVVTITTLRLEHLRGDVVWRAYSCVTVHHARLQAGKYKTRTLVTVTGW